MKKKLFNSWPKFSKKEIALVSNVLQTSEVNYWNGKNCSLFEKEFSNYINVKYSISLANGTLALELALRAIEIMQGDEVIVTPRTYVASVTSIINVGAKPVFADIDLRSGNIDPNSIKALISKKTKAIICVHALGVPCEMDEIIKIAKLKNLKVIEDCAQAHGAIYKGRKVGSIGDIGAWSFCTDKIISTGGEGGMVTTNNSKLWMRMWSYKDHGRDWKLVNKKQSKPGFKWLISSFGSNYRMTQMQAAIGRYQLRRLDNWVKKRNKNSAKIISAQKNFIGSDKLISKSYFIDDFLNGSNINACYKLSFILNIQNIKKGWNRNKIIEEINKKKIPCFHGICAEVYLEKAIKQSAYKINYRLTNAKILNDRGIMFLVHPTLSKQNIMDTNKVLTEVFSRASKHQIK